MKAKGEVVVVVGKGAVNPAQSSTPRPLQPVYSKQQPAPVNEDILIR